MLRLSSSLCVGDQVGLDYLGAKLFVRWELEQVRFLTDVLWELLEKGYKDPRIILKLSATLEIFNVHSNFG